MRTPRSCAATVAVNSKIYVLGGIDKNGKYLSTAEYYDSEKDEFVEVLNSNTDTAALSSKTSDSQRNVLPRGLAWCSAIKTGWNSITLVGGKFKTSKQKESFTPATNFELNTKIYQFQIGDDWNVLKQIEGLKNQTLFSHVRGLCLKYDGGILLAGGNNLKASSEIVKIKNLSSRQSNLDMSELESGDVIGVVHSVNYSSMVSEVYDNRQFQHLYIFGIDTESSIYKINMVDLSWESVNMPEKLKFWDYSIAITLPDGRIVITGGISGDLKKIKTSCFIITPKEAYKGMKYDYILEYKKSNPTIYPEVQGLVDNSEFAEDLDVFVAPEMQKPRYTHTSTYLNGHVYVIGGRYFGSGE